MKYCLARLAGGCVGLAAVRLLFHLDFGVWAWLRCGALLCLLYLLVRPLMQLVILPFDLFLFGLVSLFADALLIRWAAAWTPGLSLSYPQALAAALVTGLCFWPYASARKNRLGADAALKKNQEG